MTRSGTSTLPLVSGPKKAAAAQAMQPIHVPMIIGSANPVPETLGEQGQHHRHEAAEDRRLVVTEGARGRSYLGWEAFVHVGHHLSLHAAAGEQSLRDEAHRDPLEVGGEQVERRKW